MTASATTVESKPEAEVKAGAEAIGVAVDQAGG